MVVNSARGQMNNPASFQETLVRIFSEVRRVLKLQGHLILSYANREPLAWVDVFAALQESGFRAVGCAVVHSENETDYVKRGVRSCNLNLLMDLIPAADIPVEQWKPSGGKQTDQEKFLDVVSETFLRVGRLHRGWEVELTRELQRSRFLHANGGSP